ncbi:MAG: GNAT family N-acetyltransferase [Acidimicrobiales bacterium]|nr:GNAT family N-acetyltransferase [Acidimicrobiales bacterium]
MIGTRRRAALKVITVGHERYRIGPWRGADDVGYVAPLSSITAYGVDRACAKLQTLGYDHVITAALSVVEQRHFIARGFQRREGLHLLRHDLSDIPDADIAPSISSRRGRKRDRTRVLEIDGAAFEPFWRLDENGLEEAINATPASRFRVATEDDAIVGYAVSGRTRNTGYLQRLAVDPACQGAGIGTMLLADCLRWSRRARTSSVLVNTQERNEGAYRLYRNHGFEPLPDGLAVLERFASS